VAPSTLPRGAHGSCQEQPAHSAREDLVEDKRLVAFDVEGMANDVEELRKEGRTPVGERPAVAEQGVSGYGILVLQDADRVR
jgi:hypothetical protein